MCFGGMLTAVAACVSRRWWWTAGREGVVSEGRLTIVMIALADGAQVWVGQAGELTCITDEVSRSACRSNKKGMCRVVVRSEKSHALLVGSYSPAVDSE